MKQETRIALIGSIKKWEQITAGEEACNYGFNCPLCQRFNEDPTQSKSGECLRDDGEACPVAQAAGVDGCNDTPWMKWNAACHQTRSRFADTDYKRELARQELDFLRGLLPTETTANEEQA